ncbi:hypothetical protein [Clostridium perfringens]|uniref:hypothetical protein n=1 Tax=Clostridium perfringens TaxID=1502 RepID=UPI0024BD0050|nr:hypothetical protein [Clostridium perfringens]ELC8463945.1 hypothetical protein [Clostridium perfringens]
MDDIKNKTIRWECNNWFKRDDNFIQVVTPIGNKIVLNKKLSYIWTSIDYIITTDELWEKVKGEILEDEFINGLKEINSYKLISILDKEDEFDSIFD